MARANGARVRHVKDAPAPSGLNTHWRCNFTAPQANRKLRVMRWRLPPPIWISGHSRKTLLARVLHVGAVAWRLAKWSIVGGAILALLERVTRDADTAWIAAPCLAAGVLLTFLWERYGLAQSALATGRVTRWIATIAIAVLGGAGTWLAAHAIAAVLRSL
jgi:hypothetical protein